MMAQAGCSTQRVASTSRSGRAEALVSSSAAASRPPWHGVAARHLSTAHASSCVRAVPHVSVSIPQKPKLCYVGVVRASEGMSPDKSQWGSQFASLSPPLLSKTDEHFRQQGVEFVDTRSGIVVSELNALFEKVGFPRRDPAKLKIALENTHALVWARATRTTRYASEGQMVAFARATSDGVLSATIWDVSVLPSWQRGGLGRALMERLTRSLVADSIPTITLYAEPAVLGLYEKLGFVTDPEGIKGMAFAREKRDKTSAVAGTVARR
ncbi:hypothetical protein FOA52_015100 [Chlamydomonas sp. UWO 241]|nr:hypothetical protein FOA52_015100 [Chlamydomonas sp. UWO 241]